MSLCCCLRHRDWTFRCPARTRELPRPTPFCVRATVAIIAIVLIGLSRAVPKKVVSKAIVIIVVVVVVVEEEEV